MFCRQSSAVEQRPSPFLFSVFSSVFLLSVFPYVFPYSPYFVALYLIFLHAISSESVFLLTFTPLSCRLSHSLSHVLARRSSPHSQPCTPSRTPSRSLSHSQPRTLSRTPLISSRSSLSVRLTFSYRIKNGILFRENVLSGTRGSKKPVLYEENVLDGTKRCVTWMI